MRHRIRVLYIGAVESKPLHKLSLTINNVKWRLALKNNDFVLFSQHSSICRRDKMTTSTVVYYITETWLIMIFKSNSYTASDKHSVKN